MATKCTSVLLSSGEDTDKDNDTGKKKANRIKNKRYLTGVGTYKTKHCSSYESDYPVKAFKGDIYKYLCVPCRKTLVNTKA